MKTTIYILFVLYCVNQQCVANTLKLITTDVKSKKSFVFDQVQANWNVIRREQYLVFNNPNVEQKSASLKRVKIFNNNIFENCSKSNTYTDKKVLFNNVFVNNEKLLNLKSKKFGVLVKNERVISSHCAASVVNSEYSPNNRFIVFVTRDIESIHFLKNKIELWGAKYSGTMSIHLYDLISELSYKKSFDTKILSVLVDDDGVVHLVSSQEISDTKSPRDVIESLAGHPNYKYKRTYVQTDLISNETKNHSLPSNNNHRLNWAIIENSAIIR